MTGLTRQKVTLNKEDAAYGEPLRWATPNRYEDQLMRSWLLTLVLTLAGSSALAQTTPRASISPYLTPAYGTNPAHPHPVYTTKAYGISCPGERVVWVDTLTGAYYLQGERWFGRTQRGRYECERTTLAEGDRDARHGQ
jgi:hypothetical protein